MAFSCSPYREKRNYWPEGRLYANCGHRQKARTSLTSEYQGEGEGSLFCLVRICFDKEFAYVSGVCSVPFPPAGLLLNTVRSFNY